MKKSRRDQKNQNQEKRDMQNNFIREERLHKKKMSFIKSFCKFDKRQKGYTSILRHSIRSFIKKPLQAHD